MIRAWRTNNGTSGGTEQAPAQAEEVTTIFLAGFPYDATHRELENLCRFLPGFVRSKASFNRGVMLWALFDSQANAEAAISVLNEQERMGLEAFDSTKPGEVMRVVMAKSNMRDMDSTPTAHGGAHGGSPQGSLAARFHAQAAQLQAPRAWSHPPPASPVGQMRPAATMMPAKRARTMPQSQDSVDTVASVGAADSGIDEEALNGFFSNLPGFLAFKYNQKMGGGFAKFQSPDLAREVRVGWPLLT
eukprot:g28529.t1